MYCRAAVKHALGQFSIAPLLILILRKGLSRHTSAAGGKSPEVPSPYTRNNFPLDFPQRAAVDVASKSSAIFFTTEHLRSSYNPRVDSELLAEKPDAF